MPGRAAQLDYLYFIAAFYLFVILGECLILAGIERGRGWIRLAVFALLHAATFLARSAMTALGSADDPLAVSILNAASTIALAWYAVRVTHVRRPWSTLVPVAVAAVATTAGVLGGEPGLTAAGLIALGVPAGALAAAGLARRASMRPLGRRAVAALAVVMGGFGLFGAVAGALALALPTADRSAGRLVDAGLSLALAAVVVAYGAVVIRSTVRTMRRPLSPFFTVAMVATFPVLLGLGWLGTRSLAGQARAVLVEEAAVQARLHAATIGDLIAEIGGIARIVSGSHATEFLEEPRQARLHDLTALLDDVRSAHPATISYVVDAGGVVVASSDAGDPAGLAGRSLASWPAVTDALEGRHGSAFSVGPVHASRSYHATTPVRDPGGRVIGAAGVIRDLHDVESRFGTSVPFFLASPDGIVFLTRQPDALLHPLWPLLDERRAALDASREYGVIASGSLFPEMAGDGTEQMYRGESHLVSRVRLGSEGWSIVLLVPLRRVFLTRLGGIGVTLLVCLIVLVFSLVGKANLLAAARLRRSETRYRTLVESSPDWVGIVEADGTWRFVNGTALAALDRAAGEVIGRRGGDLLDAGTAATLERGLAAARAGERATFEITLPGPDGPRGWDFLAVPLRQDEMHLAAVMLIGSDITDSRAAEVRLLRAERLAAVGSLAAGVAHQFNNIHMTALGSLELARAEGGLPERAARRIDGAREALRRAGEITGRMLALAEGPPAAVGGTRLADAVNAALLRSAVDLEREGVTVRPDLRDDRPAAIDAARLALVIDTLLSNAIHAVLDRPRREIAITTSSESGRATLRIEDTGAGIPPGRLAGIFTPFSSDKGEHARPGSPQARVRGVGLGLALAQSLLSARGGSIEVRSAPGEGAVFTVRLPLAEGGS